MDFRVYGFEGGCYYFFNQRKFKALYIGKPQLANGFGT
jgi:hypothetical protein